ncbi:hypothetical protein FACS1894201_05540 [Bacteroidia bacterium]|nr:hypothetical protein FACS1894201_05540 [Bacteroidia bacterium]
MIFRKILLGILAIFLCSDVLLAQQGSVEQLAVEYRNNGEPEKALKLFEEAYDKAPSQQIYTLYMQTLIEQKSYKEAEKLSTRHRRRFPNDKENQVDLGYIYQLQGEADKADKTFRKIIDETSANPQSIGELAMLFYQKRLNTYAIVTLENGQKMTNDPTLYAMDLATMYERSGRMAEAVKQCVTLLIQERGYYNEVERHFQSLIGNNPDDKTLTAIRQALLVEVQTYPDNTAIQKLWIGFLMQTKDYSTAFTFTKSFERRNNDGGQQVLQFAKVLSAQDSIVENPYIFGIAEEAFKYIIAKGEQAPLYFQARSELLSLYYKRVTKSSVTNEDDLAYLEQEYDYLLRRAPLTDKSVSPLREWAWIEAAYRKDFQKADSLVHAALNIPRIQPLMQAECKLTLADIYLLSDDVWEAMLLYSQVEKDFKHDEIGFTAKMRNAQLSYYIGEFDWSLAQLDVLRSSTSKLIANDAMSLSLLIRENNDADSSYTTLKLFATADFRIYQQRIDEAELYLDSILLNNPAHTIVDEVLMRKADISLRQKRFTQALDFYKRIYEQHADQLLADDALFLAARLYEEQLQQPFPAMTLYEQLIMDYPSSLYIEEARRRFRNLRGH